MEEENKTSDATKNSMLKWAVLGIVVIVVVGGLLYYLAMPKSTVNSSTQTQNVQQETPTAVQAPDSTQVTAQKVTIGGNEFAFTPSTIIFKKGQPAEITFKNTGKYPHNLDIKDLGLTTKTIQPGEQDTITFTPDKAGKFAFVCTVPGHADKGMTGTLTIE